MILLSLFGRPRLKISEWKGEYFEGRLLYFESLDGPGVGLALDSIGSLKLQRLVEAVKDGSEEDFSELFEIGNSLSLLFGVLPFGVKVNELICVLPVLVEKIDVHYIFILGVRGQVFSSKISESDKILLEDVMGCGSDRSQQILLDDRV